MADVGCVVAARQRVRRAVQAAGEHPAVIATTVHTPGTGATAHWRGEIVIAGETIPPAVCEAIAEADAAIDGVAPRRYPIQRVVTVV